jgi:hypothetical protein
MHTTVVTLPSAWLRAPTPLLLPSFALAPVVTRFFGSPARFWVPVEVLACMQISRGAGALGINIRR